MLMRQTRIELRGTLGVLKRLIPSAESVQSVAQPVMGRRVVRIERRWRGGTSFARLVLGAHCSMARERPRLGDVRLEFQGLR